MLSRHPYACAFPNLSSPQPLAPCHTVPLTLILQVSLRYLFGENYFSHNKLFLNMNKQNIFKYELFYLPQVSTPAISILCQYIWKWRWPQWEGQNWKANKSPIISVQWQIVLWGSITRNFVTFIFQYQIFKRCSLLHSPARRNYECSEYS